jgi:hypothetical protein
LGFELVCHLIDGGIHVFGYVFDVGAKAIASLKAEVAAVKMLGHIEEDKRLDGFGYESLNFLPKFFFGIAFEGRRRRHVLEREVKLHTTSQEESDLPVQLTPDFASDDGVTGGLWWLSSVGCGSKEPSHLPQKSL